MTSLTSSTNPSAYGQAVTFTAVVTSSIGAPPDGETVRFMKGTTVLDGGTERRLGHVNDLDVSSGCQLYQGGVWLTRNS